MATRLNPSYESHQIHLKNDIWLRYSYKLVENLVFNNARETMAKHSPLFHRMHTFIGYFVGNYNHRENSKWDTTHLGGPAEGRDVSNVKLVPCVIKYTNIGSYVWLSATFK